MNRACAGQTVLDLFPAPPRDHVEDTLKWMCDVHGCIRGEIEGEVRELYRDFGTVEAFDRCKALVDFHDGQVGVFDPGVEVHTVWDRCWAATHGLPMGQVFRLRSWDYGRKRPGSWME